ncbi:MAG: hypothetical protein WBA10_13385 [Elainellaceae cyanobacterium]
MTLVERLSADLQNYCRRVSTLKDEDKAENILPLLRKRDRIQVLINQLIQKPDAPDLPPELWSQLAKADNQLKKQITQLDKTEHLSEWRRSLQPPAEHWWWFLEPEQRKPLLGWLFGGLTLALIAVSLAFAKDIATRFFTGAPGIWSSIGAVVPVFLALFAAGGALTKLGQQIVDALLEQRGWGPRCWPLAKFLFALALFTGLFLGHWQGLPLAAQQYYATGYRQYYDDKQPSKAQVNFQRSLQLQPDFPKANHHLALTYEDLRQFDQAKTEYTKAAQAGYLPSTNNLSRLLIAQDEDYDSAAVLLKTALQDERRDKDDTELEYGLRKNIGWAWLKQARLTSAEGELLRAIALAESLPNPRPEAHCLLAELKQQQEKNDEARSQWETCLRLANRPEHDTLAGMATKALLELDQETP